MADDGDLTLLQVPADAAGPGFVTGANGVFPSFFDFLPTIRKIRCRLGGLEIGRIYGYRHDLRVSGNVAKCSLFACESTSTISEGETSSS